MGPAGAGLLGVGLSSVDVTTTREPVKNTGNPLRSFKERNVRIFFGGIAISNIGTWAQLTVLVLLVRELGGGGLELGIVTACRFAPLLFLGLYAGAIADRVDRHRRTMQMQGRTRHPGVGTWSCRLARHGNVAAALRHLDGAGFLDSVR